VIVPMNEELPPPLVMRFGAFGDMVLLTVLLRQLQARFGKPVDVISSGVWTEPLLHGQTSVGRLFVIRSRRTPYWMSLDQRCLVAWLRKRGAGPTWFCDMHLGMDLLERGGIPAEYICDSRAYPWQPEETFADRFIRLANETPKGLVGRLPPPHAAVSRAAELVVEPQDRDDLQAWLARRRLAGRPFVVVHPGSRHIARRGLRSRTGVEKYWPEANWGRVIASVREMKPDHMVVLTGTPKERALNADIIAASGASEVYNIAGELPVRRLLALLERAHSIISVDTGPAHAAAALGCPTVSLFGPTSAILYRPGGTTTPAVALTGQLDGVQAMLGITVDRVISAWIELIRTTKSAPADSVKFLTCD
jgi:heptosyltransferase-2/heptosyltransferase-3